MFNKEEVKRKIQDAVIPDDVDINLGEIKAIYEMGSNPFNLITNAFIYGFLKGKGDNNE